MVTKIFLRALCLWAVVASVGLFGLSSCSDDDNVGSVRQQQVKKIKVAVFMDRALEARWKRTAQWANENLAKAQENQDCRIEIEPTFYIQNNNDTLVKRVREVLNDTTVDMIIGPTSSRKALEAARVLTANAGRHKPMITPCATQTEFQRMYSDQAFIWNMAESYLAELETLIASIAQKTYPKTNGIVLVASADDQDYIEWFSFLAQEYGLTVTGIFTYSSNEELQNIIKENFAKAWQRKDVIFSPTDPEACLAFDEQYTKTKDEEYGNIQRDDTYSFFRPYFYCTGGFVRDTIAASAKNYYQGIDLCADVESGFAQAYSIRFGEDLVNGEAQFYDALMLTAYGATLANHTGQKLEKAISDILAENDGSEDNTSGWLPDDIAPNFSSLAQGKISNCLSSASGPWKFDGMYHTNAHESTYRLWKLSDDMLGFVTLGFTSASMRHSDSSNANIWEQIASRADSTFDIHGTIPTYPELHQTWALLVAGSTGWDNYRFQADVFAMYQMLIENGYDDDHIILICEDDLVNNPRNTKEKGILRTTDDGKNVYNAQAIDYKVSDLEPDDIGRILQGKKSDRLPHVIEATENDNIFIFWSSHGSIKRTVYFGNEREIYYDDFKSYLKDAPHRKIFMAVEACYSGGLGEECVGIPGLLVLTAANPYESSHASSWSYSMSMYRSNSFTQGFQDYMNTMTSGTVRDLYFLITKTVYGSHPKLYNIENFGYIYNEDLYEYIYHWNYPVEKPRR